MPPSLSTSPAGTSGDSVNKTGRALANVSKHLKQLAEAGLVARRKEGLQVFYRLDDPVVERICQVVCDSIYRDVGAEMERQRKLLRGKERPG